MKLIDSHSTASQISDHQLEFPNLISPLPITEFNPIGSRQYCRELQITPSPLNSQLDEIRFFLNYYRENITEYHYFFYHDYRKFFKVELLVMAKQSRVLYLALAAFSAMIYSIKHPNARKQAFWYYALALTQLRDLLNAVTNLNEYHLAIATALQLATFDVQVDRKT